jgi:hypothetical protein
MLLQFADWYLTLDLLSNDITFKEGNPLVRRAFEKNLEFIVLLVKGIFTFLLFGLGIVRIKDEELNKNVFFRNLYHSILLSSTFIMTFVVSILVMYRWF